MSAAVACRVCGVATDEGLEHRDTFTPAGQPFGPGYDVGTCPACADLDPDRPGLAVRAALRVLGKEGEDDVLAARAFEDAGVEVTEVLYETGGRAKGGPQRRAFAHVGRDGRGALKVGYARLLDLRVHAAAGGDRPVPPTAPPSGPPGCLLCGVGASASWRPVRTKALTRGPDFVDGHLCDTCSEQHDSVGAVGAPLVEKAAMEAQGLQWSEAARAPGLKAWIATGLPPGEPWAWVELVPPAPDLDPLDALRFQVADLQREVAELRARLP